MRLVYTDKAVNDLKRLREFIAVHEPSAASRIAAELITRIELLSESPTMGIPVDMAPVPQSIRDMVCGRYVVRYSVHASAIIILRIWHQREDER